LNAPLSADDRQSRHPSAAAFSSRNLGQNEGFRVCFAHLHCPINSLRGRVEFVEADLRIPVGLGARSNPALLYLWQEWDDGTFERNVVGRLFVRGHNLQILPRSISICLSPLLPYGRIGNSWPSRSSRGNANLVDGAAATWWAEKEIW